jgi:hypothetical protein
MFDMMLGPLGTQYWVGPSAMPQARFHHDWSKVAFLNALLNQPLDGFSYAIGTQNPAAIAAATGIAPANLFDTSIGKADSLSKDCIATHFGVELQQTVQVTAADAVRLLADTRLLNRNFMFQVFYGERTNEEVSGTAEDFPAGRGTAWYDGTAAWCGSNNGLEAFSNVKPLPQPLACKGGETYFRVTVSPAIRAPGVTLAVIEAFMLHVYGVAPARRPPVEAHNNAMQALALPR